MGTPFYHAAATKAQPFPSNHFRKSSTRDRLTTISNSGRGRAVIFSRLPRDVYKRQRMHLPLEELLHKETFNESLHDMIACSGRR